MQEVTIISLGGSIIAPGEVHPGLIKSTLRTVYKGESSPSGSIPQWLKIIDIELLRDFTGAIKEYLENNNKKKVIIVTGGGAPARHYQQAYREIMGESSLPEQADWIGIAATRLNAQLLKAVFHPYCREEVVNDPTTVDHFSGRVLIAAGWKPGFSTDYDAVILAERFSAGVLINLSNIEMVYTDDPKTNPSATPIDKIDWNRFIGLIGEEWRPGKNVPFDPVAARRAGEIGLKVIVASGKDIENLKAILNGEMFRGTVIG